MLRTGWSWEELKACPVLELQELVLQLERDEKRQAQRAQ